MSEKEARRRGGKERARDRRDDMQRYGADARRCRMQSESNEAALLPLLMVAFDAPC